MRRTDREITDYHQMLEILQQCDCCRLGLVDNGEAYIVPMNFGISQEDGKLVLYFHSAKEGRKMALLHKQPFVSFQADTGHRLLEGANAGSFSFAYRCVMGRGRVQLLSDPDEMARGLQAIMAHYTGKTDWNFDLPCRNRIHIIKLTVTHWSCKAH